MGTTLIIPTIKARQGKNNLLSEALTSATEQTLPFEHIFIEHDVNREGPAVVRNRAAMQVETDWMAFLDDDDLLKPQHHEVLAGLADQSGADVCWPWFDVLGGTDPFPMFRGRQWDPDDPHQIPITVLVRTEAFHAVGGFQTVPDGPTDQHGNRAGEDWRLWLDLSAAGFKFAHTPTITWTWRHHGKNTSGLPSKW